MEKLVSIIIPIYNTSQFLKQCLDSVCSQTYSNIEILLINDGSNDNSEDICLEYRRKDNRIKYFYKENSGLSDARNYGINEASGDFIYFVDSDDFVEKDLIQHCVKQILEYDADIVEIDFALFDGNNYKKKKGSHLLCLNQFEAVRTICRGNMIENNAWSKLYKAELVKKVSFLSGRFAEDIIYNLSILPLCNRVLVDTRHYYYNYRIQENSIMNNKVFSDKHYEYILDLEEIVRNCDKKYYKYLQAKIIREKVKCLNRLNSCTNSKDYCNVYQLFINDIKKYSFLDSIKYLSKKHFITLNLMKFCPKLYQYLYYKFQKQ